MITMNDKTDYAQFFDRFWETRGKYAGYRNPERAYTNIRRRLEKCNSIADIDEYVMTSRTEKETLREIITQYYFFLEEVEEIFVDSEITEIEFARYRIERLLNMAKYLHEPRTVSEIEEHFKIDRRTRTAYIQDLEKGVRFMGSTIKIEKHREGGKDYYKTTMHPIFLPLNLTEVYAITKFLEDVIDNRDANAIVIRNIQERIKSQLTDYAFEKLFPGEERKYISNDYISDREMAAQRETVMLYLIKDGQRCRCIYKGGEYEGSIQKDADKYYIRQADGDRIEVDPNELEIIIESVKYK